MLRNPVPTGVVMGAFSAMPLRRMDSTVASGRGVPSRSMTSRPASATSHLMPAPVASMHRRVASAISGPIPSPLISVTFVIRVHS